MQPFDALTLKAVLQEAKPLILNHRVDRVQQLGRDELLISLRAKSEFINLLMSAQSVYGRICLTKPPATERETKERSGKQPTGAKSQSGFATLLRKHLYGATLVGVEHSVGERTVDFVFSCTDEVGSTSIKVLTAEIMGRHSNLIFWDKASEKIVCASHNVTSEMSSKREVSPGLQFARAPRQEKLSVFIAQESQFKENFGKLMAAVAQGDKAHPHYAPTAEQWLLNSYTGLGKNLAAELVTAAGVPSRTDALNEVSEPAEKMWRQVQALQTIDQYKPAMKTDLSSYTVLSWSIKAEQTAGWQRFQSVNDLVDEYYRLSETREQFRQFRERLKSEIKVESEKIRLRIQSAATQLKDGDSAENLKLSGDLVLANIARIQPGDEELICENVFDDNASEIKIKLNPNITPAQNAQHFYRQLTKSKARKNAVEKARDEASQRLNQLNDQLISIEASSTIEQLRILKDQMVVRRPNEVLKHKPPPAKKKNKARLLTTTSSDGWTIYVGRNRLDNDYLLTKLSQPHDLWLHVLGQGGAHVLVRVPASKQDPPLATIKEAAYCAAKLSKAAGAKVRVIYTQCRHVRKIAGEGPGVVRYENEKTIEVDTAAPMPNCMKSLFQ